MAGRTNISILAILLLVFSFHAAQCQDNVFWLMKSDSRLADQYYERKNFRKALDLYWSIYKKSASPATVKVKIARCYYFLKEYKEAVAVFETLARASSPMHQDDQYYFAESLASNGNYRKAIDAYRQYLKRVSEDTIVAQKLWRLSNIRYLYEDSVHYHIQPLPINTEDGELCVVPYRDGVVFLSNRKEVNLIEKVDAAHSRLYRTYFSAETLDSVTGNRRFKEPRPFNIGNNSKLHAGPMSFYAEGKKVVFASSADEPSKKGNRSLHLYFAEEVGGKWKVIESFPFNSTQYSTTDPSMDEEGNVLFFSSDMPGGRGGKDIYRSIKVGGKWQKPENLGDPVNTPHDEVFPFLHLGRTLYFSSNGHPGFGGLDIFKTDHINSRWDEVMNMGFPVNSNGDEFGIIVNKQSTHAFFASNREDKGFNDDLYEVEIGLQNYPIQISGIIRIKDHSWSDTTKLNPFRLAKVVLIDNLRDVSVYEGMSDEGGNFSVVIPYYSKYEIRVIGSDNDEHVVSLEIPKQRKEYGKHEIVIVRDLFRSPEN